LKRPKVQFKDEEEVYMIKDEEECWKIGDRRREHQRQVDNHFYFDCAATSHFVHNVNMLENKREVEGEVDGATGKSRIEVRGEVRLECEVPIRLKNTACLSTLKRNLVSTRRLDQGGCKTINYNGKMWVVNMQTRRVIMRGVLTPFGLYRVIERGDEKDEEIREYLKKVGDFDEREDEAIISEFEILEMREEKRRETLKEERRSKKVMKEAKKKLKRGEEEIKNGVKKEKRRGISAVQQQANTPQQYQQPTQPAQK
jgi:hypothetical protein